MYILCNKSDQVIQQRRIPLIKKRLEIHTPCNSRSLGDMMSITYSRLLFKIEEVFQYEDGHIE